MKRLELRVEGAEFKGKRFSVPPAGLRLGRSSSNDIAIHDSELSRNHCLFEPVGESGVRITDLASANGTFLNERRLGSEAVELKVGDVIRVGESCVTVVGETDRIDFDLGLGEKVASGGEAKNVVPVEAPRRRAPLVNVLWGVAAVILGLAIFLMLKTPEKPVANIEEIREEKPQLSELRYEKVTADSASIFRYYLSLTGDGALHVKIDDLSGEGRHINRSAQLKESARAQLMEMLSDEAFNALDHEYTGPEEDPPKLNSWEITYLTTSNLKTVKVLNTQEPDAFRRVREKLETFSMNELGIRALQYSREKLLEMAHTAANTARMKWEDRDVEHGNLFNAICFYREAIADLETVNPKPPEFAEYAAALEVANKELDKRYKDKRFDAEQATSVGDWEKAKLELRTLCDMIPDREDERNHEAALKLIDIEKRLGKKGGRK